MLLTFDQGLILLLLGVVLGTKIQSKRMQSIAKKAKEILSDEQAKESDKEKGDLA